jgi:GNAT superfamily N-acetyltransferase
MSARRLSGARPMARSRSTLPAIAIRVARQSDAPAIVRLRLALLAEEEALPDAAPTRSGERLAAARTLTERQLAAPSARIFLATHAGRAVGMLRVAATRGSVLLGESGYGTLTTAYVAPGYRRHGIMRQLVEQAVAWCRRHALADVRLRCSASNLDANAAWAALGFPVAAVVRRRPA